MLPGATVTVPVGGGWLPWALLGGAVALGLGLLVWQQQRRLHRLEQALPSAGTLAASRADERANGRADERAIGLATQPAFASATGPSAPAPSAWPDLEPDLVAAILVATLAHRALRRREAALPTRSYSPGSLLYASRWVGNGRARQNHSWQRRGR